MTSSPTMMAAVLDTYGGPFRLTEVLRPSPGPGQALIRIASSGINPLDTKIRAGTADHARQALPAILGIDMAGKVESLGVGVRHFKPGDEVFGMTGGVGGHQGTLAEYAAVDADLLAHKPSNLSMREASVLPLVFITAWEGLVDHMAVHAGHTVLVLGGAGGVGRMAIQIARARGAQVSATGSLSDLTAISQLGACFINRSEPVEDFVASLTGGIGFDLVFDTVGGTALDDAFLAVRRYGHVASVLGWGTHALAPLSFRAGSYSGVFTLLPLLTGEGRAHQGEILVEAKRLVEAGQLTPWLDPRHFTLETVGEAYQVITEGTARGKLAIDIGQEVAP